MDLGSMSFIICRRFCQNVFNSNHTNLQVIFKVVALFWKKRVVTSSMPCPILPCAWWRARRVLKEDEILSSPMDNTFPHFLCTLQSNEWCELLLSVRGEEMRSDSEERNHSQQRVAIFLNKSKLCDHFSNTLIVSKPIFNLSVTMRPATYTKNVKVTAAALKTPNTLALFWSSCVWRFSNVSWVISSPSTRTHASPFRFGVGGQNSELVPHNCSRYHKEMDEEA